MSKIAEHSDEALPCDGVPMQNVYFMLCYASRCWKHLLDDCPIDDDCHFDNVTELLAFLLAREAVYLAKRGLKRDYIRRDSSLSSPHGHINMQPSFKLLVSHKAQLDCTYSEYSANTRLNGIIAFALRHVKSERDETRQMIYRVMPYFDEFDEVEPTASALSSLNYDRSSAHYRFAISLCRFLYEHILPSELAGKSRFNEAEREKYLSTIFEDFIREYYREHLGSAVGVHYQVSESNKRVFWALNGAAPTCLPQMESDVWIEKNKGKNDAELFIIDAKFYRKTLNDRGTFRSENLYQIQSYMLNAQMNNRTPFSRVHGCLLYPRTGDNIEQDIPHCIGTISVRTVDLNQSWQSILKQMDDIWRSLDTGENGTVCR